MPKGFPVDLDALQLELWKRTDRRGLIKLVQGDLAAELGITKFTMSRVINRMIDEQRIRQISNRGNNAGRFQVSEP